MNICVFCGSGLDVGEPYVSAMAELGKAICERGHNLVFGGYDTGLMGAVAHGVVDNGGEVLGVVPYEVDKFEDRQIYGTQIFEVPGMSDRKNKMKELAQAFIAGPGGFGTFDELYEVLVDEKLTKTAPKPIAIYDVAGFYSWFGPFAQKLRAENFVWDSDLALFFVQTDPYELVVELERRVAAAG